MTKYIFYTAAENDRWDLIAYKFYRNSYRISEIIEANPHIAITGTIPEGTELKIPIPEEKTPETNKSLLPIWKQKE